MTERTAPPRAITDNRSTTARLVVYAPNEAPCSYRFGGDRLDIGRLPVNGICVDDPRISGTHARIQRDKERGELEIVDRRSSNGTFVDGRRVDRALLKSQSVIRVGDTLLILEEGRHPIADTSPLRSLFSDWLLIKSEAVALNPTTVLLTGPTGAGKGFIAHRIAALADRSEPFIQVNCAALPPDLVESQLFGHVRGAFTGALTDQPGLIRTAEGGTLFLDEVGSISSLLQAKLLTFLEQSAVRPVGDTREIRVDVRVIAATNLDVDVAIADGTFRKDLFYRLAGHTIDLPPLRQRRVDIIRLLASKLKPSDHRLFTAEAFEALLLYSWPGNIRELLNLGKQLATWVDRPIDYDALPIDWTGFIVGRAQSSRQSKRSQAPPRAVLRAELEAANGNISALARRLGKHRNQVVRWLDLYDLRRKN